MSRLWRTAQNAQRAGIRDFNQLVTAMREALGGDVMLSGAKHLIPKLARIAGMNLITVFSTRR
jgi:hypothetical protein